jgi:hypothetical protein
LHNLENTQHCFISKKKYIYYYSLFLVQWSDYNVKGEFFNLKT